MPPPRRRARQGARHHHRRRGRRAEPTPRRPLPRARTSPSPACTRRSRGVRLLDDDPSGETTQHAGLARAIVHLQHAIGACVPDPNLARSRACRAALEATRLDARVRLGPMLVAVGRLEDAVETCRRGLAAWDDANDDANDEDTRTTANRLFAPWGLTPTTACASPRV